MKRAPTSNKV